MIFKDFELVLMGAVKALLSVSMLCVFVFLLRSSRGENGPFPCFCWLALLGHVVGKTFKHLIKGSCHSGGRLELEFLKFFLKSSVN